MEAIDERTAVVAAPHCHFMTGALLDLASIGAARATGAVFVVDATQSLGSLPQRVDEVGADMVVAARYHWLLGPHSRGYTWTAPLRRDWRPLEQHQAGRVPGLRLEPGRGIEPGPIHYEDSAGWRPLTR